MLRNQIISVFNPLRYCTRWFAVVGDSTENHKEWRTPVLTHLVSNYGHENLVQKLFRENPEYEKSDLNIWKNFMKTLYLNGFDYRDCFRILKRCPKVLGYPPEQLDTALNKWRTILPSDMLKFLILNNPEYLNLDNTCISKRGQFFLHYCTSRESLLTMLFLCPNLMYENWEEIIKKIEFLNNEMVILKSEIFNSKALSKPLQHIKLRFSVLEKCGLYTRPNPNIHKQTQKERLKLNNPKLKDITDKSDNSFAKKIAKISIEEYNTYSELFDKYENDDESDESDSDAEN